MKQKTAYIAFITFFCILLLSVGVIGYSHEHQASLSSNIKQKTAAQNTITLIPTGSGNIRSTASWSRYIYNHEFSISYPPFWNVVVDKDGNGVNFMTAGFHQDDDFSMPYGNSYDVSYVIFGQHDTSDMNFQDGDQFQSDTTSETMVVKNLKHIQIDGFPAVAFDYYPTDNTNFLRSRIAVLKGNTMYRFNAVYAQDSNKQLFEEMMQSLKFI